MLVLKTDILKKCLPLWKVPESHYSNLDYQYLQQSKIPTMHFQKSLPRHPIPKLDLTCERYLAAQKPLLIEEAYRKTEANVNHFKTHVGKYLQKMLKNNDQQYKQTSYISELLYDHNLKQRNPLPINYNPMLVMHNEQDGYNDQLIRTANLVISSLRFYKSLTDNLLEPEVYFLNPQVGDTTTFELVCSTLPESLAWYGAYLFKAYPLDMSQYPKLFNTTRIPEIDKDRIVTNMHGNHITVQYKGHIYAFAVLDKDRNVLLPEQILARLKFILDDDVEKNAYPIGILTTLERNLWATLRHELAEMGNEQALKLIDSALFNVCLDDVLVDEDPYAISRNFLHSDGENRWFDKSFSLQVSKDGVAAVNFEDSWGDGIAVLRYVQEIYNDSKENPKVHPHTKPCEEDINNILRLDMNLNDKLKSSVKDAIEEYSKICKSLAIDYLILDGIGRNICRKQAVSPDAIMQLGFQIGYHRITGKFVPTSEICSTAAFKHGRTEIVRSCTMATKAFTLAINSRNRPPMHDLKLMLAECSRVHNQLTREAAMGQGFDRHLFALKHYAEKTNMVSNIFVDPDYDRLNQIVLSTSTLSSPAIYAGGFGPVVKNGLGIGYIIKDEELGVLVTSYPTYQRGSHFIDALRDVFAELVTILDHD